MCANFSALMLFELILPSTNVSASMMLDFPEPFGPSMTLNPCSKSISVLLANDLNPERISLLTQVMDGLLL